MTFVEQHGYLIAVMMGLPLVLVAIVFAGRHRATVLLAGAIELLHSPPAPLFDDLYWSPYRLGGVSWGAEDLLVCFSLGATVWFAAILPFMSRLTTRLEIRRIVGCVLAIGLPSAALGLLLDTYLTTRMEAIIWAMVATSAVIAIWRPDLIRLSGAAILLYTPYYIAFLYLCGLIIPDFFMIWNGPQLWGLSILGIPFDEVAFIVAFATCYPLIIGVVFDARLAIGAEANRAEPGARGSSPVHRRLQELPVRDKR